MAVMHPHEHVKKKVLLYIMGEVDQMHRGRKNDRGGGRIKIMTSAHQHMDASAHQHMDASAHQHMDASAHQCQHDMRFAPDTINAPAHQCAMQSPDALVFRRLRGILTTFF